jgi:hypothetical protein
MSLEYLFVEPSLVSGALLDMAGSLPALGKMDVGNQHHSGGEVTLLGSSSRTTGSEGMFPALTDLTLRSNLAVVEKLIESRFASAPLLNLTIVTNSHASGVNNFAFLRLIPKKLSILEIRFAKRGYRPYPLMRSDMQGNLRDWNDLGSVTRLIILSQIFTSSVNSWTVGPTFLTYA